MANLKKNGNLSGAVGNIVFVNDGERVYVRTKPASVKQSPRTKASSKAFGLVSTREKLFRLKLLQEMGIRALQYFAARHRAVIRKTLIAENGNGSETAQAFAHPQALAGFSFNPKSEWLYRTNFYPSFEMQPENQMKIALPELKWKDQILPPKYSSSAVLSLLAVTADLNSASVPLHVASRLEIEISGSSASPAQEWIFPVDPAGDWLLIVGCIRFNGQKTAIRAEEFSAAYLWTGLVGG